MQAFVRNLIIISIFILTGKLVDAQDLALNKSYTLSALPNYPATAPSSDKTSLTDGVYTKGYFWSKKTTVGWVRRQVRITIDLGKIQSVGAVSFNSVRRSDQNVNFPRDIFVFISQDNKNFQYVGDAAKGNNSPGAYQVKKLILANINKNARYISLTVLPTGHSIFCDEIEVLPGKSSPTFPSTDIPVDQINSAVDSLINNDFQRENLKLILRKMVTASGTATNVTNIETERKNTQKNTKDLLEKVRNVHATILKKAFNSSFILEKYNPWDTLEALYTPRTNSKIVKYEFLIASNGSDYGAFVLSNTNSKAQTFRFNKKGDSLSLFQLFNVSFVPSTNGQLIPDPMVPVDSSIQLASGTSQLFIFKITAKNTGKSEHSITVLSGRHSVSLNIETKILDFEGFNKDLAVNAVNWAYLSSPLLKDRRKEVVQDLDSHHINTIVVPPQYIPKPGNTNFNSLIKYIANFKYAKNILIAAGFSTVGNRHLNKEIQILTPQWKRDFSNWYSQLLAAIKSAGFSSNIFFYPFDEVHGKDIEIFKELAIWGKGSVPGLNFYATLSTKQAIDSILPLIDVAQIQSNPILLSKLPPHHCEIWVYGGSSPSRNLSPYGFYRLMAWRAFENDMTGIGFWNYADEGLDKQLNLISDPMINPSVSYSVIYDGPGNQIISSRRWEAFSLGIEDYSILKIYSKKFGTKKTKELVEQVIANPSNTSLAEKIKREILESL